VTARAQRSWRTRTISTRSGSTPGAGNARLDPHDPARLDDRVQRPPQTHLTLVHRHDLADLLQLLEVRTTVVQAPREHQVSETSISNGKRQFIEAGCVGLIPGCSAETAVRKAELETENEQFRAALDEAMVLVRVRTMSAEGRLGPSRTSR
jgi:transposase